jgi:predicted nuclease with TOPRIM domain
MDAAGGGQKQEVKGQSKEKIKEWSELKKLIKDWQQQFREQTSDFRVLVEEARKRELKLCECRQQLAAFKRRVMAAEHTQKIVDEKIRKIQVRRFEYINHFWQLKLFHSKIIWIYLRNWTRYR